jgi:Tfp pilus assembly protein PilX
MPLRLSSRPAGSTLIITMILLTVLTVIGVAAVSLGSQERINASGKGKRDALYACANAARMQIWAELAKYGRGYFESTDSPSALVLPDGTTLTAPAHYNASMTTEMKVKDIVLRNSVQTTSEVGAVDLTNTFHFMQGLSHATAYSVVARCRDSNGNELEIEFVTSLVL